MTYQHARFRDDVAERDDSFRTAPRSKTGTAPAHGRGSHRTPLPATAREHRGIGDTFAEGRRDLPRTAIELDPLSRTVVRLSLRETLTSVIGQSRLARWSCHFFGFATPRGLASERLESLRRYCILYRLGDEQSIEEERQLRDAYGYSADALSEVRTEIRRGIRGVVPARVAG